MTDLNGQPPGWNPVLYQVELIPQSVECIKTGSGLEIVVHHRRLTKQRGLFGVGRVASRGSPDRPPESHQGERGALRQDRKFTFVVGRAAILQRYRVVYREAHTLLEELTEATLAGTRKGLIWWKLLGDTAAVTALVDRLLHHVHVLKCGPRSWRTNAHTDLRPEEGMR